MKSILYVILFISCLVSKGQMLSQENQKQKSTMPPSKRDAVMKKIREEATKHDKLATASQLVKYDIVFPSNLNDFKKLNTHGVLYVTIISNRILEHPIKVAYLKTQQESGECGKIAEVKVPVQDSLIAAVFGKNQIDYYFFIPYFFTKTPGQLTIDWNDNKKSQVLCQFPQNMPLDYIKNQSDIYPEHDKQIDDKTLREFVGKEFQLNISKGPH